MGKEFHQAYEYLGITFVANIKCDFFRKSVNNTNIVLDFYEGDNIVINKSINKIDNDNVYTYAIKDYIIYQISKNKIICHCKKKEYFYYTICNIPFAILAILNNILPLHCSAINHSDKVFAFLGNKGAGKSTLCYNLLHKNQNVLLFGDDAISLSINNSNIYANCGINYLKVNEDIIDKLDIDRKYIKRISAEFDKFFYTNIICSNQNHYNKIILFQLCKDIDKSRLLNQNEISFYLKKNILSLEFIYPNLTMQINRLIKKYSCLINRFVLLKYSFD